MKNELNKKAEELEQTLQMQLDLAKKESEEWIKVGGVVLAGALITFATVKLLGRKKNKKTQKVLNALEKEGLLDDEIKAKLTQKSQPGFLGRLGAVLLPIAVSYGRDQLMNRLKEPEIKTGEDAK
jgi:hypothetical protein